MGEDYPQQAPKVNVVTPMHHINVTDGKLCPNLVFGGSWAPSKNLRSVLANVQARPCPL